MSTAELQQTDTNKLYSGVTETLLFLTSTCHVEPYACNPVVQSRYTSQLYVCMVTSKHVELEGVLQVLFRITNVI